MQLNVNEIVTTAGTQMRACICNEVVQDYQEAENLPPVIVFRLPDGRQVLAEGFHRLEAAIRSGRKTIAAQVIEGDLRAAILFASGANAEHGLRRSNEDKRRAVMTLLQDAEWSQWSDREIARQCGVSHVFVGRLRDSLSGNVSTSGAEPDRKPEPSGPAAGGNVTTQQSSQFTESDEFEFAEDEPEEPKVWRPLSEVTPAKKVDENPPAEKLGPPVPGDEESFPPPEAPLTESEAAALQRALSVKVRLQGMRRNLAADYKRFRAAMETPEAAALLPYEQSLKNAWDTIGKYLKSVEPYCVCFRCQGPGCAACKGRGWLDKSEHDSRNPNDMPVVWVRNATHSEITTETQRTQRKGSADEGLG